MKNTNKKIKVLRASTLLRLLKWMCELHSFYFTFMILLTP